MSELRGARPRIRVSIIMSVRDAAATLPVALASLQFQTLAEWELLVADDGSRDGSREQLENFAADEPRAHMFMHDSSRGLAQRLNELAAHASAPLIARMDADDVCYPSRLERQVALMDGLPGVDLVGASVLVFGPGGRPIGQRIGPAEHADIVRRPHGGFPLYHPSWLGRAAWFKAHPYDPGAVRCEDQDLLFRTHQQARFANLTELLLGYREDHLTLGNLLGGRLHMARRWSPSLWADGHKGRAVATVVEQVTKGAVDALGVSLSAERVLLRHRARAISAAQAEEWAFVWRQATGAAMPQTGARPESSAR